MVVAVGNALASHDGALERLRTLLLLVGPFALLLASYAGYQVAGAALRPVERMRRRAEQITEHDAAERLPVPDTRDEIEALGRTLNELLERLDAALARERRLLSDASHELRTPLTVLRTGIQVALRRERDVDELRAALESAEHEAGRVTRIAEDLLVVARADQGRLPLRLEPLVARRAARGGRPGGPARRPSRRGVSCGWRATAPARWCWPTGTAPARRSTTWSRTRSRTAAEPCGSPHVPPASASSCT